MEIPMTKLSVRASGALTRHGIVTYDALSRKTAKELIGLKNVGRKTLAEIRALLAEAGYSLARAPLGPTPTEELTDNEREVLRLREDALSYVKIAHRLNLSPGRIVQIELSALRKVETCPTQRREL